MLPLPAEQTGEEWKTFKKQCYFGNRGALDRKILSYLKGQQYAPIYAVSYVQVPPTKSRMPLVSQPCVPLALHISTITPVIYGEQYNQEDPHYAVYSSLLSLHLKPERLSHHTFLECSPSMFFPQCERPSFKPIQNNVLNYSSALKLIYHFKSFSFTVFCVSEDIGQGAHRKQTCHMHNFVHSVDRAASLYRFLLITHLTHFFTYLLISSLYLSRASQCSSSGDRIVLIHHLL